VPASHGTCAMGEAKTVLVHRPPMGEVNKIGQCKMASEEFFMCWEEREGWEGGQTSMSLTFSTKFVVIPYQGGLCWVVHSSF
jgi:hypothetical protein